MKKLKRILFLLLILNIVSSCNSAVEKIKRPNEPDIYIVGEIDIEMNKAMETAKQTLDSFDYAIKNNSRIFTYFGLKKRVEENNIVEHIWIGNIQVDNGKYIGVVDNLPENLKSIKLGDTVQIPLQTISDWMYIKNSELHGGYTITLLRDRMSEKERQIFDKQSGLKIK